MLGSLGTLASSTTNIGRHDTTERYVFTLLSATSDKVYQLLVHVRWFSLGTPASSTTKTGHHDIAGILLKVVLNTKNQISPISPVLNGVSMAGKH